jgi:hypothetical protein
MQRSSINPNIFGELLNSASNAADKGQAQFFTPPKFAKQLAAGLPAFRPVICDLTCGNSQLLEGISTRDTAHWLGCDIDPAGALPHRKLTFIHSDLTTLHPMLLEVEWEADLFALNPPWDMHWYRDRLKDLADSALPGVAHAFDAHDGRTSRDTIDSTVATLMMALDRCTHRGEGLLIANESTLQRLTRWRHSRAGDLHPAVRTLLRCAAPHRGVLREARHRSGSSDVRSLVAPSHPGSLPPLQ